jgi:class 3 adenylate cyclase
MAIESHNGEMIKTLGDGVLATFTGPAQAVRCGERLVAEARALGLEVASGSIRAKSSAAVMTSPDLLCT